MCIRSSSAEVIIKSFCQLNIPALNSFCARIVILPGNIIEADKIIGISTEIMCGEGSFVINACIKTDFLGFALFRIQLFTAIERIVKFIHIRSAEKFLVRYIHVSQIIKFIGKHAAACCLVAILGMLGEAHTGSKAPGAKLHLVLNKESLVIYSTGHVRRILIMIFVHSVFIVIIAANNSMITVCICQLFREAPGFFTHQPQGYRISSIIIQI